jgi:hypothetical protein
VVLLEPGLLIIFLKLDVNKSACVTYILLDVLVRTAKQTYITLSKAPLMFEVKHCKSN